MLENVHDLLASLEILGGSLERREGHCDILAKGVEMFCSGLLLEVCSFASVLRLLPQFLAFLLSLDKPVLERLHPFDRGPPLGHHWRRLYDLLARLCGGTRDVQLELIEDEIGESSPVISLLLQTGRGGNQQLRVEG